MFKWQLECLSLPEVLSGKNLIVSAPTSTGKSLIGEFIALKCILESEKVILIQPYKTAVSMTEKYLNNIFELSEVTVKGVLESLLSFGDASNLNFAIYTIEKA